MKFFQDPRVTRVLRPAGTLLGFFAAVLHASHALSAWRQCQEYKTSDPALSDYFWSSFQTELGVTIAAMFAGVVAWHLFKPRSPVTPT